MNRQSTHRIFAALLLLGVIGCRAHGTAGPASQRDTAQARALNDQAFALIGKGDYSAAEKLLKKAVDADVMFGPAHNNLGLVYYHENKLYDAAWEFQNAIKLMPYVPEPRNNLGLVLERAGKLDVATDHYARALSMEPDNPEYLGNLARAKLRRGDHDDQTKKLLEELVSKDPRPDWNHWAKMNLFRLNRPPLDESPSHPATMPATQS